MKYPVILFCLLLSVLVYAQDQKSYIKSEMKRGETLLKASQINYPGDGTVDIKYYKLDLELTYSPNYLSGNVEVKASSLVPELSTFFLDLYDALIVDSIVSENQSLTFTEANHKLNITLPKTYNLNEEFSVTVYYRGVPRSTGFGSFSFDTTPDGKLSMYTLSEPYGSSDWWPCKDTPADKADSADIWITCAENLIAVSNGLLEEIVQNGNGTKTYKWKNHYPIAQYLISLAISGYTEYLQYFNYSENDSMPVVHYIYPERFDAAKVHLDKTVGMLQVFTDKFGPYPFLKEKYGHAQFGWGGGMEHQTISSMGAFGTSIISHELAHQWFGDKITCRDWQNIWLNEGFATYAEAVYDEAVGGKSAYLSNISAEMSNAKNAQGTIYVQDISSVSEIFKGSRSYSKGAVVLHMLRGIVGDSIFFDIMKTYAMHPSLVYGTAVTEDFQAIAESVYGSSLEYFFHEWIYTSGYPSYSVQWSSNDLNDLSINIKQNQSNLFTMPVQIGIATDAGDTLITILNNEKNQTFNFHLIGKPYNIVFDPYSWILKSVTVSNITDINDGQLINSYSLDQNYPNPFNNSTVISYQLQSKGSVSIKLFDELGREIKVLLNEEKESGEHSFQFSGDDLPSGIYYYTLNVNGYNQTKKMTLLK